MKNRKSRLVVASKPFILALKKKDSEEYSLIGGNIDKGESPIESLVREVFEEAGYKLEKNEFTILDYQFYLKEGVEFERYYFNLLNSNAQFELKEMHKFERLEWVDFNDHSNKFKLKDKEVINKLFNFLQ